VPRHPINAGLKKRDHIFKLFENPADGIASSYFRAKNMALH
jgi:hypothetical protein